MWDRPTVPIMPIAIRQRLIANVSRCPCAGRFLGQVSFESDKEVRDAGWVVMKVEDRRPEEQITLEAARPQIVRFLTYNRVRDLLENLRKGSKPSDHAPLLMRLADD